MKARKLNKRGIWKYYWTTNCLYKVCGEKRFVVNLEGYESDHPKVTRWRTPERTLPNILILKQITFEEAKQLSPKVVTE